MKIIFGTTSKRKLQDINKIIEMNNLDIDVLNLNDIKWDLGEIEETGVTLEENSLIKAQAIYNFCLNHNITYPIITDDAGLFVNALNGEPGIFTKRYADEEIKNNPNLPSWEAINKVLRNLEDRTDRSAYYKSVVTCFFPDGTYEQESSITNGTIATEIKGALNQPYMYSIFIYNGKPFSNLSDEELLDTYRFKALNKILSKIK